MVNPNMNDLEISEVVPEKPDIKGDRLNFCLLIFLYILQGLCVGLTLALPIILQNKKLITYEDQAMFSISGWPYVMKLLWAPVVDAFYSKRLGRRKSWLLPVQAIMGICLIYMANNIDEWLPTSGKPNLNMLVTLVFILNLMSATQDIIVDGWSLTIMKKRNLGYASTCNSIGLSIGIFIGNIGFILLVSEDFNNKYIRTVAAVGGIITIKSLLWLYSMGFLLITLLVGMFKTEKNSASENGDEKITVYQNYKILWEIFKLPRIRVLLVALFTARIGFCAMDSVSSLKLIDAGVSKEDIMIMHTATFAVKFVLPIFISKFITGPKPMNYYLKVMPIRLTWSLAYALLIYFTPSIILKNGTVDVPVYYYFTLGLVYLMNDMMNYFMLLALYAFICRISDPRFGGTYMTLFSTFYLGFLVINTFILELVSVMTVRQCSNDVWNYCNTSDLEKSCKTDGGSCTVFIDSYYTATALCMVIGFIWYGIFRKIMRKYQSLDIQSWMVTFKHNDT